MGIFKRIGQAISTGVKHVVKGAEWLAVKTVEVTVDVVSAVAHATASVIDYGARKLNEWGNKLHQVGDNILQPKDKVPPEVVDIYQPAIIQGTKDAVNQIFPVGIIKEATTGDSTERVKKIEQLMELEAQVLGIDSVPELVPMAPDSPEQTWNWFGGYCYAANELRINLPMIISDNPELFREQCSTVCHELVHARQRQAVEAWLKGESFARFGYSEEYVIKLANNFANYIRPEENYEAYTKQPIEAEAYWYEQQIKQYLA